MFRVGETCFWTCKIVTLKSCYTLYDAARVNVLCVNGPCWHCNTLPHTGLGSDMCECRLNTATPCCNTRQPWHTRFDLGSACESRVGGNFVLNNVILKTCAPCSINTLPHTAAQHTATPYNSHTLQHNKLPHPATHSNSTRDFGSNASESRIGGNFFWIL